MGKDYYIYNPETDNYERVKPTWKNRAVTLLVRLLFGGSFGAVAFVILFMIFGSPAEKRLRQENNRLITQYNVISKQLDQALEVMNDIKQRDENLYRVIFLADPIPDDVRNATYAGTNRYEDLMDMVNADLVVNTTKKIDMLRRQIYVQSQSFDEIVDLSKRDFLFILEHMVVAMQKIEANHLDVGDIALDLHHVFINKATRELRFLYAPTKRIKHEIELREFVESVVYSAKPYEPEDPEFISRFVCFFNSEKHVDLERIERYVAHEDDSVVRWIRKQAGGQSGFITNKLLHYVEHYDGKQVDEDATALLEPAMENPDDEATGLLDDGYAHECGAVVDDDEATGLLQQEVWDEEKTGLLWQDNLQDESATAMLSENDTVPLQDEDEGTALLDEAAYGVHFPTLYRISSGERISVNKPVFRIGKEKSYVDYFVTNNVAVSRSHADIIARGRKFFVVDLNSKNHTYINDELLPTHCEVEIHNEDRLRLGNEEFVFQI